METNGSLPEIILNKRNVYNGNLIHYFQVIFNLANNLGEPYHNFRHMMNVVYLCYEACIFYARRELTPLEARILLIAAMFHDFDHMGKIGNDFVNIRRAVVGIRTYILPEDKFLLDEIVALIESTEYPHQVSASQLSLSARILRDCDLAQCFSSAWIQQVVFGLSIELHKSPLEVLADQEGFLKRLEFSTVWGSEKFPRELVEKKVKEAREILQVLEGLSV